MTIQMSLGLALSLFDRTYAIMADEMTHDCTASFDDPLGPECECGLRATEESPMPTKQPWQDRREPSYDPDDPKTIRSYRDDEDEAWMAYHEHTAYKEPECLLDRCGTCEDLLIAAEDASAAVPTLDCDSCGRLVPLRNEPRFLVLVLCRDCNGGTAIC